MSDISPEPVVDTKRLWERKPRLTAKVLRGLAAMSTIAESAEANNIEGLRALRDSRIQTMEDIKAAYKWVRAMQHYRRPKYNPNAAAPRLPGLRP